METVLACGSVVEVRQRLIGRDRTHIFLENDSGEAVAVVVEEEPVALDHRVLIRIKGLASDR